MGGVCFVMGVWRKQTLSRREIGFIPVCCCLLMQPWLSVPSSGYITLQLCVWKIPKRHQAAVRFPWRIRHLIHSIPQSLLRAGQDLKPGFLDFVSTIRRGKIMYTHHAGRVYTCRSHAHVHARAHTRHACTHALSCTHMHTIHAL